VGRPRRERVTGLAPSATGGLRFGASWLAGLAAEWDARLAAIKRVAEEAGDPPR
jgi:hypothetical protein